MNTYRKIDREFKQNTKGVLFINDRKNKILESWIMVEHLSEGDIGLNDKAILTLNDLQEQDFYSLFLHEIEKKKWNQRQKGGVVVYFDIFKFQEVVDILHAEYGLESTDEDIRFGDKFSFALYFDKNLNFSGGYDILYRKCLHTEIQKSSL